MKRKGPESRLRFWHARLGNWKNFVNVDIALQNRTFLVGPNASGKSNFLDAFRFLKDLVSPGGGFQEAVNRRGGVAALRCLAARRQSDVEIQVEARDEEGKSSWKYEIAFNKSRTGLPRLKRERVVRNGEVILDRPNDEDRQDPDRLTQTHLEQVNVNKPFRELALFFSSISYLHIVPQVIREPDRSPGRPNDPFGGDFLARIAKVSDKKRDDRLKRITDALRAAIPRLKEIEVWRDARGAPRLRGKFQHWRTRDAWQTEEQFSDGTLRLMGLLWAMLEGEGPLLLEEPELSLHSGIVRVLPQMFARLQRLSGRQIFIGTHSPDLLRDDGIGLDEVILFVPQAQGSEVKVMADGRDAQSLLEGGLTLADIVVPQTSPGEVDQLTLFGDG
ncbi:MAG: ATP-binding protein [Pseudomonadota bacterium]